MPDLFDFPPGVLVPDIPRPPRLKKPERTYVDDQALQAAIEQRSGLPVLAIPEPAPAAGAPAARPSFPTGPAANDPIFSNAAKFLRYGGYVVSAASVLDLAIRYAQEERINEEYRQMEEWDRIVARRLGADNPLPVIVLESPLDRPPPEYEPPRLPEVVETPPQIPPVVEEIPGVQIEFPEVEPDIRPEPVQTPPRQPVGDPGYEVDPEFNPLPDGLPGQDAPPEALPDPDILPDPLIDPRPGFGQPGAVPSFPSARPAFDPYSPPARSPRNRPVGDPLQGLRPTSQPRRLTGFQEDPLSFTQPAARPRQDPARRRCQDEAPTPRVACYKGLYKEGRMSNEIDFTEWAEIDCETGVELDGSKARKLGDNVIDLFGSI